MEDSTKAEIIKGTTEIVKTAYEDAFQPVAQETGKALGTLGKTVNVALSPLRGLVWGYEHIETFIHDKVSQKLEAKGVPEVNIITPDPDIAVPTVEALRYSKLKNEFATLLSSAMNSEVAADAHPAFVEVLKQMSPLDAAIIRCLKPDDGVAVLIIVERISETQGMRESVRLFGGELESLQMTNPSQFQVAIDNLERMKIIDFFRHRMLTDQKLYRDIRQQETALKLKETLEKNYIEEKGYVELTLFGSTFKRVCI